MKIKNNINYKNVVNTTYMIRNIYYHTFITNKQQSLLEKVVETERKIDGFIRICTEASSKSKTNGEYDNGSEDVLFSV